MAWNARLSRIPNDEWRLIVLATIGFLLAAFVAANEREGGQSAFWYMLCIVFFTGTAIWAGGTQGIGSKWSRNLFIGAMMSGVFIIMHMWAPSIFDLGFPKAVSEGAKLALIGFIAPIGEEILFRQGLYLMVLRQRYGFLPSAVISSVVFAAFHWYAYGLGAASAAYIGALSFGMIAAWLTEETGDCLASTVMHIAVNIALLSMPFVVVSVV